MKERVEMTNRSGQIARPYPNAVKTWEKAGWTVVEKPKAKKRLVVEDEAQSAIGHNDE